MKSYLITGTAGFIGFHFAQKLLENGFQVLAHISGNTKPLYDQEVIPYGNQEKETRCEKIAGKEQSF